jgi:hypothetical protein
MGFKKIVIQLEKELISWFGRVKRMERKRIPKRALKLKHKGARPMR